MTSILVIDAYGIVLPNHPYLNCGGGVIFKLKAVLRLSGEDSSCNLSFRHE